MIQWGCIVDAINNALTRLVLDTVVPVKLRLHPTEAKWSTSHALVGEQRRGGYTPAGPRRGRSFPLDVQE